MADSDCVGGECAESGWLDRYLFGQCIVGAASDIDHPYGIRDPLYRRGIQREDGELDATGVNPVETLRVQVQ